MQLHPTRNTTLGTCLLCIGALVLPASALADYGPKRAVYGGKATGGETANRVHPVSVTLSRNGKQIKQLRLTAPAACTPSGSLNPSPAWEDVKIRRNGEFSDTDQFTQRTADGSERITWSSQVQGKLTERGGSGKSRDVATVRDASGNVTKKCDTGVVRFNLKRGNRVFGGLLKLGRGFPAFGVRYPVSVERNRSGNKLTSFRVRYIAKCGPTSHHTNSFEHFNVRLDGDDDFAVTRDFTYRSTTSTTRYVGSITLRGHLGDRRGSGTYRAKFRAVLGNGDTIPCDTGRRKWSVSQH